MVQWTVPVGGLEESEDISQRHFIGSLSHTPTASGNLHHVCIIIISGHEYFTYCRADNTVAMSCGPAHMHNNMHYVIHLNVISSGE